MAPKFSSKKLTRSHTTLTDAAGVIVKHASQMPEVSKISLGIIKPISVGKQRIKFLPITGGVKSIIRGNSSIQEIFIYTKEPKTTIKVLTDYFNSK
ncbi:MAG: DUF2103 domain-containing protein [bacterium]